MPSGNMFTGKRRAHRPHQLRARRQSRRSCSPPPSARPPAPPSTSATSGPSKTAPTSSPPTPTSTASRTVYIPVTKRADASTLDVINRVKAAIPDFKKVVPEDVDVRLEFDQSPYVRNSIRGLVDRRSARRRSSPASWSCSSCATGAAP